MGPGVNGMGKILRIAPERAAIGRSERRGDGSSFLSGAILRNRAGMSPTSLESTER
jgi:hypothetical protein